MDTGQPCFTMDSLDNGQARITMDSLDIKQPGFTLDSLASPWTAWTLDSLVSTLTLDRLVILDYIYNMNASYKNRTALSKQLSQNQDF